MDEQAPKVNKRSQRRDCRTCAVQFLYQWELNKPEELNDALRVFIEDQEFSRDYYAFAEELIHGAIDNIEKIDDEIMSHASNWTFGYGSRRGHKRI